MSALGIDDDDVTVQSTRKSTSAEDYIRKVQNAALILSGHYSTVGRDIYQVTRIMKGLIDKKTNKNKNPTLHSKLNAALQYATHLKDLQPDRILVIDKADLEKHLKAVAKKIGTFPP
eukprot:6277699-Pyramimonas_sp.AAC.1